MDLGLEPENQSVKIDGYGEGFFRISGKKISSSVILFPKIYFKTDNNISNIRDTIIQYSKKNKIDLIIYGTYEELNLSNNKITNNLGKIGFPIEIMSTGAACRTWSVLIGEGRKVCACLISKE